MIREQLFPHPLSQKPATSQTHFSGRGVVGKLNWVWLFWNGAQLALNE
jgi:hypothetical protein